ncbi:uncharacterized protein UTRI_04249 [Ustilago trichophora]|uniref:Uncharacterized protein n=1 Tax=Ustilago trichophora TaxID=86804 RepID=A0A5C3ER93_9BASI|nr:uncharacterized protein UTRI_04249 [Ustilago trichophora]
MLPSTSAPVLRVTTRTLTSRLVAQRTFISTPSRSLAQPPSQSEADQLNEAQRYLADKAARKAARASNPTGASARHASLYSQLFPALLRILAYGSSAYFGLHLLWNVLDRDEQTKLMNAQTSGLEATAKSIVEKVDTAKQQVGDAVSGAASEAEHKAGKKRWYWPF